MFCSLDTFYFTHKSEKKVNKSVFKKFFNFEIIFQSLLHNWKRKSEKTKDREILIYINRETFKYSLFEKYIRDIDMSRKVKFGQNYIKIDNEVFSLKSEDIEFIRSWWKEFGFRKGIDLLKKIVKAFKISNPQDYVERWYILSLIEHHKELVELFVDLIYSNYEK